MPVVHHNAERAEAAPVIALNGRESNLFKLLDFINKKQGGATSEDVGRFLGTSHKSQAILRGSTRIKGLQRDGFLVRGAQTQDDGRESHAAYTVTDKGLATLRAGSVIASEKDRAALAAGTTTAV